MRLRTLSVIAILLFCFNPAGEARPADNQRTKIAIVGLVHSHCWGYVTKLNQMHQNQDLIEVVGVSDDNQELRDYIKTLMPGIPVYDNYARLLDEKKPEIVWSFVENDRHLEITKACAARKINVMFEKPMSATYDQARQMMALAKQAGIQLMVNYQMAWWPENYTAHDVAARGDLGRVWRVRSVIGHGGPGNVEPNSIRQKYFLKWLKDESRGGGALIDFTCYGAKWALWYLGLPKTVYAITTHTRPDIYPSNTNATVLMSYADNKVAITEGSWDLPRSFYDVEVFGDKGSVAMKYPKTLELYIGTEKKPLELGKLEGARADPIHYFVDCIRNHKSVEGVINGDFNVDVMQIVEAAKRSAASGMPVNLPLK